ncbi:hypothetical protein PRNP1_008035 [Phytophthora ramorum]
MQASTQANALVQDDEFIEEPEREDSDMEVELGVNLFDAFTKKHVLNFNGRATMVQSPVSWAGVLCPPAIDTYTGGLLPAGCDRDGDRSSSMELDDVAQEILSKALLEDQDATSMEVDSPAMPFLNSEDSSTSHKLEMVVFLYAFEKFRIVYA